VLAGVLAVALSAVLAACSTGQAPAPAASAAPGPSGTAAPGTVVMVIRHGEKPEGSQHGIDAQGNEDDSSLTTVGWERAQKLVDLFDPQSGEPRAGLARPAAIYAAGANDEGEGARTRETVAPLADRLGITVNTDYGKGDEEKLIDQVSEEPGPTLISWAHGELPTIAESFPNVTPKPPKDWPDDRFDVVWTFTKTADGWHFAQVPELVMPGDQSDVISSK